MKKIAFLFLLFFCVPCIVWGKNLELENLTIKNGSLSIPFDKLNNEYTVVLDKEEYQLDLEYEVDNSITVFVKDNHDLMNNSVVTISLTDEKNIVEYHLQILKEEEEVTTNVFLEEKPISLETSFMYEYKIYIIPAVCFLLLFITFKLLFPKKKKPHQK